MSISLRIDSQAERLTRCDLMQLWRYDLLQLDTTDNSFLIPDT